MKIGILGGTFDPIHLGHLQLARCAQTQFNLERVFFIPVYNPPHKTELKNLTSPQDRYEMVRLAMAGEPTFEASDCELSRQGVSYTIDTIREFSKKFPKAEIYLILGQDAYEGMSAWRESLEIRKRVKLVVAKRRTGKMNETATSNVQFIQMPLCPISASEIRKIIKEGGEVDDYLPEKVLRYIQRQGLYQKR